MSLKRVFHTVITSYVGLLSMIITSLLMVRLASHSLSLSEFGLWSFTTQSIGYFLLLDFGISGVLGRLFAEPLSSGNQREINELFTIAVVALCVQACLIAVAGLICRDWILSFFNIPDHLIPDAKLLWTFMLVLQAVAFPFRVCGAILFAQNRNHLGNSFAALSSWMVFFVFWICLKLNCGVMSYAYGATSGVIVGSVGNLVAIKMGPTQFGLFFGKIAWRKVRELFALAMGAFFVSLAVQVEFVSQSLIITKLMGLEASAIFQVTSRMPQLVLQMIFRPFDAFIPRWQQQFSLRGSEAVTREITATTRATILLGAVGASGLIIVNPIFVKVWTNESFFGGDLLNGLLASWFLLQVVLHCFSFGFVLQKRMNVWGILQAITTAISIFGSIYAVNRFGLAGIPIASLFALALGLQWFILWKGGALLGMDWLKVFFSDAVWWIPGVALAPLVGNYISPSNMALFYGIGLTGVLGLPALLRCVFVFREKNK